MRSGLSVDWRMSPRGTHRDRRADLGGTLTVALDGADRDMCDLPCLLRFGVLRQLRYPEVLNSAFAGVMVSVFPELSYWRASGTLTVARCGCHIVRRLGLPRRVTLGLLGLIAASQLLGFIVVTNKLEGAIVILNIVTLLFGSVILWLLLRVYVPRVRIVLRAKVPPRRASLCLHCGYPLSGPRVDGAMCAECGQRHANRHFNRLLFPRYQELWEQDPAVAIRVFLRAQNDSEYAWRFHLLLIALFLVAMGTLTVARVTENGLIAVPVGVIALLCCPVLVYAFIHRSIRREIAIRIRLLSNGSSRLSPDRTASSVLTSR
jgi:hypothetical protein